MLFSVYIHVKYISCRSCVVALEANFYLFFRFWVKSRDYVWQWSLDFLTHNFHIRQTIDLRSYSSALTVLPFLVKTIVWYLTMIIAQLLKAQVDSPQASLIHYRSLIVRTAPTIHNLLPPLNISNGWIGFIWNSFSKHDPTVGRTVHLFWGWLLSHFRLQLVRSQLHSCWLWEVGRRYLWLLRHCMTVTWWAAFIPLSIVCSSPLHFDKTLIAHLFSNWLWQPLLRSPSVFVLSSSNLFP